MRSLPETLRRRFGIGVAHAISVRPEAVHEFGAQPVEAAVPVRGLLVRSGENGEALGNAHLSARVFLHPESVARSQLQDSVEALQELGGHRIDFVEDHGPTLEHCPQHRPRHECAEGGAVLCA